MKYLPGRSSASALVAAALGMRMFWGLAVDFPFAINASWLCPLLSFLIFLPFCIMINRIDVTGTGSIWNKLTSDMPGWIVCVYKLLISLILIYDATVNVRLLASSSNLIALNNITVHILVFPIALLIAVTVLLGCDPAGNSARIWLKFLPLFAIVLLAVQIKSYRIGWLTPVLGGGLNSIIHGAMYCAGCLCLASMSWLISVPDRNKKTLTACTFFPCVAVSGLMATQHLSFPALINIPLTRAARIELVLSNGRMSLSPQLLLDILWFGGMLYLISAESVTAAAYLTGIHKKMTKRWTALILSVGICVCAIFNPEWLGASAGQMKLLYLEITGIILSLIILKKILKGVKSSARV